MVGPSEVSATSNEVQPPTSVWMIQALTVGMSDKYVPAPTAKAMLSDQISMVQNLHTKMRQGTDQVVKGEKDRKDEEKRRSQTMLPTQTFRQMPILLEKRIPHGMISL